MTARWLSACLVAFLLFSLPVAVLAEPPAPEPANEKPADEAAASNTAAPANKETVGNEAGPEEADTELGEEQAVADPLEPFNRVMFKFNDKLYFWVLKPVAKGYNKILPEEIRGEVRNFFSNVAMPIRFVNNLLQGKIKGAGNELSRFVINSTFGMGGLFDAAKTHFNINKSDQDLGLTFGAYGIGNGFYVVWPFIGPSTARDSVGKVGDGFLDPINYVGTTLDTVAIHGYERINDVSLHLGEYEDLKESSLDSYIAIRDAYVQHRKSRIKK
ncbi:MAG TPA: VacJ family lipoprotein [Dissulfurispiraceae bacterium]